MNNSLADTIRNQLSEKITVYVNEDLYRSLHKDADNFEVKNLNSFINRLVKNYVKDYFDSIYRTIPDIKKVLFRDCKNNDTETINSLAKEIAFIKTNESKAKRSLSKKINFRLNNGIVNDAVEAFYSAPASIDISAFFRNMFLSYLALPIYRRERIIYKSEVEKIESIINKNEKMSYVYKSKDKSRVFLPACIEVSKYEMFNYVVGQFGDHSGHISSIRLSNITEIVHIHETAVFRDDFDECLDSMKKNGIQFSIDSVKTYKVTLDEQQYITYKRKYYERPEPIHKIDEETTNNHILYFDCSEFQLRTYFKPFENIEIVEEK